MPKEFKGLTTNFLPTLYVPLEVENLVYSDTTLKDPSHFALFVLGRLTSRHSLRDAQAQTLAIAPSVWRSGLIPIDLVDQLKEFHLTAESGRSAVSWTKDSYLNSLFSMERLALALMGVCVFNISLLIKARLQRRSHENIIRHALGASRWLITRQVVAEVLSLAMIGAAFGDWDECSADGMWRQGAVASELAFYSGVPTETIAANAYA